VRAAAWRRIAGSIEEQEEERDKDSSEILFAHDVGKEALDRARTEYREKLKRRNDSNEEKKREASSEPE
jgi:hypothetical protein